MFRNALEPWHLILIFLVIMLVFGGKKLPELARGTGRALRIFKAETKGLMDDDEPTEPSKPAAELNEGKASSQERSSADDKVHHTTD